MAPGQTFWLRHIAGVTAGTVCADFASAASTSVAFQSAHREVTQQPLFTKSSKPTGSTRLRVTSSVTGRDDELVIQVDPSWSNDFVPGEDGLKFFGFSPNLFGVQGSQQLVFARYNTVVDSIMLGVQSENNDSLTLEMVSSNAALGDMMLEDLMLDIVTDFNSGAYSFVHDANFGYNRFVLHIVPYTNIGTEEQEALPMKAWLNRQTLYLSFEEDVQADGVQVYDLSGREIMRLDGPLTGLQRIPFNAPSGLYIVAVSGGGSQRVFKVVQP